MFVIALAAVVSSLLDRCVTGQKQGRLSCRESYNGRLRGLEMDLIQYSSKRAADVFISLRTSQAGTTETEGLENRDSRSPQTLANSAPMGTDLGNRTEKENTPGECQSSDVGSVGSPVDKAQVPSTPGTSSCEGASGKLFLFCFCSLVRFIFSHCLRICSFKMILQFSSV